MQSISRNNRFFRKANKMFLRAFFLVILFSIFPLSSACAETVTVNPVAKWTPVLVEFQLPEARAMAGNPGPPFTRIEAQFPSIPSAWETLKNMVSIKLKGQLRSEDEPIISGWQPWAGQRGESGIEVKRSDRCPEGFFPVITMERGGAVAVHWSIQIWGRYRFPDYPDLLPADDEYQKLIKQKIEVRDFSLTIHEVEGGVGLENIRNDAAAEPSEVLGSWQGQGTLAEYEAQSYQFPARADFVGELQLKMKLYFPEIDDQQETAYETPVEASLRFMCGSKVSIRIISDKIMRVPGGEE
ncbi:hypothetical protein IBX65_08845 [Candidatus Aerophobetes bacterium]|nr:hypothetical protein [Candidatus Aerophobetes bacterium]